jgi:hypothetical protein
MGMYAVLSILFLLLVWNVIAAGPENEQPCIRSTGAPVAAS